MSLHLLLPTPSVLPLNFLVVADPIRVPGYQLYAVEKWIVDRNRPVSLLVVYTGDPAHSVLLTPLTPVPDNDLQQHWDKAIQLLRADGARPKHTPNGVLMVTSLAHFRSDYTIVHIPNGDFLPVNDQLYANINLLRMGCSGRSALTLEDPTDSTKDRFISAYHLPHPYQSPPISPVRSHSKPIRPSIHAITPTPVASSWSQPSQSTPALPTKKDTYSRTIERSAFVATVLELVKLIQAGLSIFRMYGSSDLVLDGLLCDVTVDGIRTWIADIGGPCVGLEPTERIADPMFVSALLSLVLSIRNKLCHLGYFVPRDPFLSPHLFSLGLTSYIQSTAAPAIPTYTLAAHQLSIPLSNVTSTASSSTLPVGADLTRDLVDAITASYDAKSKQENRRVGRVLKNKLGPSGERFPISNPGPDSDGAEGDREYHRRSTLSMSRSLSGAEDRSVVQIPSGPHTGIGSSGGQIFTGIGSLASGLGLAGVSMGGGGACEVLNPTVDLTSFLRVVMAKESSTGSRKSRRSRDYRKESVDIGIGYAYRHSTSLSMSREKDGVVGASVKALWSGRVADIIRLRDGEPSAENKKPHVTAGREKDKWKRVGLTLSDDELERREKNKYDGRSTEEESDIHLASGHHSFGGMFSGKMRGKLGSWAGLAKRKTLSADLGVASSHNSLFNTKHPSPRTPSKLIIDPLRRSLPGSGAQSPTLPPMVFSAEGDRDHEEDDLLSSGQVSPLSDYRHNPFLVPSTNQATSADNSTLHLRSLNALNPNESERTLSKLLAQKRPWDRRQLSSTRVNSWADPVSAREGVEGESGEGSGVDAGKKRRKTDDEFFDGELESDVSAAASRFGSSFKDIGTAGLDNLGAKWKRKEKARFHSLLSVVDGEGVLFEEPLEEEDENDAESVVSEHELFRGKRRSRFDPRRRRSFHDLEDFRDMDVLTVARMLIDVNLCGQALIMHRREKHLQNVIATVKHLVHSMANTNRLILEHYETHFDPLTEIDERARILSEMDEENIKTDRMSQATNTLKYEAEQFLVSDLWHTAKQPRHKVLALREKVFGMGGRRLPPGMHGAHGPFNRLQWTIDGEWRLVDHLGRTESEEEEETRVDSVKPFMDQDEEDTVEHPGIKPMWLLRFFTGWNARWSVGSTKEEEPKNGDKPVEQPIPTADADVPETTVETS